MPLAASVPVRVKVPPARLLEVMVVMPWALVEPVTSKLLNGEMQEVAASEWRIPVRAALVPVSSPERAGSLAAEAAVEANCQFPVTVMAGPELAVSFTEVQPVSVEKAKIRRVTAKRRALEGAQDGARPKDIWLVSAGLGKALRIQSQRCGRSSCKTFEEGFYVSAGHEWPTIINLHQIS